MVAEADADRATAVLSAHPSPFRQREPLHRQRGSHCGSLDITGRPQYAAIPLAIGFAGGMVLAVRGSVFWALTTFGVAAAIGSMIFARVRERRCRSCGRKHER